MASKKESKYKCTLSPETLAKAMEELNESPDNRLLEVKTLRKRIEKIPGLKPRTDTEFLLAFLRGSCFDQEKTFALIKNYYQVKKDRSDVFDDLKPTRVKHVVDSNMFEVLRHRDNDGRRVIVFRSKYWNPDKIPMIELIKVYAIYVIKLIEEEETQVNGVRLISECGGITMKQITSIGLSQSQFIVNLAFLYFPLYIKRADHINENKFFDAFFKLFSQFMDAELIKRIYFHGKKLEELHETMNPDHIPTDLGGNEEPFSNKEWVDELLDSDKWFEENNKYGFLSMKLENEKKESAKENAGMQGLGGSFKKLEM